jgi:predicted HTH transcriptional regulator
MNKKELALILHEGESLTVEFKENVNSDLSKELVAMANSIGGRIFIGINDQNIQTGIIRNNTLLSQIQDMATHCDPPVPIVLIASLLHRAGYIEKMGTGISRIKNALAAAGEPKPVFKFDSFFTVTFKRTAQETAASAQETAQENIISVIRKNPNITRNEIARELNTTPDKIKHLLVKLTKLHRIQHIGATKKGYWQITKKDA